MEAKIRVKGSMRMNKNLWKAISLLTIFLFVLSLVGQNVAGVYSARINEVLGIETSKVVGGEGSAVYYTSDYSDLNTMFQAKIQLLRDIADEGTVLLKNDGTLPMASGTVGIFGEDQFVIATQYGGGAIPDALRRHCASLTDAFRANGLTVSQNDCNLSLVVVGRSAGEGTDVPQGSLALTDADRKNIDAAKASGGKVVVLLSGDHAIEAGELKSDPEIAAILQLGNAGFRGAYGVADVITGKANPSGKLVHTFAANIGNTPAVRNFGNFTYTNGGKIKASQAKNYVVYAEGIYMDYRYYETRYEDSVLGQGNSGAWNYDDEVVWPFGYGLSYTNFSKEITDVSFDDAAHTATITVKVTNTGSAAGKEVVQVYAQSPYTDYDKANLVEKASVQLMGFEKTKLLAPNESETLSVTVHLQWLASYDFMTAKGYILDAGDYYFSLGNGAHEAIENILAAKGKPAGDAALTYMWTQEALDTETYKNSVYTNVTVTNAFAEADLNTWIPNKVTYLSRADWQGTFPETVEIEASADMIAALNDTKRYENGIWNDTKARAAVTEVKYENLTTADAVNDALNKLGAENVTSLRGLSYDDPAWNKVLDRLSIYELSQLTANGNYSIKSAPSVTFPGSLSADSPIGLQKPYLYRSFDPQTGEKTPVSENETLTDSINESPLPVADLTANMFASESVLGATFNKELAEKQGRIWGEDSLYTGVANIYAPGVNLHRTPYSGRASEYVSADPILTTLLISDLVQGCMEKGLFVTVKHFVINEQEQNRIGIATFTNEQAIRELYLRAFEGVMTYGNANGLMSSYNRIGLISTATEYDLMTGVLRSEWGSNAFAITDLGAPTAGLYEGNASVAAGISTMMNNGVYDDASKAYVNQTLTPENIKADPVLLTAAREACHRILYNFIHSNAINGISEDAKIVLITPWYQTALRTMVIVFGVLMGGSTLLYLILANKKRED